MSTKLNLKNLFILLFLSPFLLTSTAFGQPASSEPAVSFDRMWIDYNAIRDNEFGMLIHVSFTVRQLKDIPMSLGFAIELVNSDRVYADNPDYSSTNGQLTVYRKLNNRFDASVYSDVEVFLPYREIPAGARGQDLRIHLDVLYENGGNIHVAYYNFSFIR